MTMPVGQQPPHLTCGERGMVAARSTESMEMTQGTKATLPRTGEAQHLAVNWI